MRVAVQYSHRLSRTLESRAGANDLSGFIDALEMNARKNISRPTIPSSDCSDFVRAITTVLLLQLQL
jgi:hypothetical protein